MYEIFRTFAGWNTKTEFIMKEKVLKTTVQVMSWDELSAAEQELMDVAKSQTQKSYSPYSHFQVGAAVRLERLSWERIRRMLPIRADCVPREPRCLQPVQCTRSYRYVYWR